VSAARSNLTPGARAYLDALNGPPECWCYMPALRPTGGARPYDPDEAPVLDDSPPILVRGPARSTQDTKGTK
jgi:hypothetical protein